jgi:hypothetical protein
MYVPTAASEPSLPKTERPTAANRLRPDGALASRLTVARVGFLAAPATHFAGVVHSVFARACNIEGPCGLFTIATHALSDGPTVWRLAAGDVPDFDRLFCRGDPLQRRHAVATAGDVVLDLSEAVTWRPPPWPSRASRFVASNLEIAGAALERRRRLCRSVVDREAGSSLRSLEKACRDVDIPRAIAAIDRLVGWGEGLTPAGDDAIVGFLAAIGALAGTDAKRMAFVDALSAAVVSRAGRTTDISAHYLRLAAQGHFNADVRRLVHALVGGESRDGAGVPAARDAAHDAAPAGAPDASLAEAPYAPLHSALDAALDVGATSGADMLAGVMAGFRASCPANA